MEGFNAISLKLKEMYQVWKSPPVPLSHRHTPFLRKTCKYYLSYCLQMITLGGDAELELVDSLDPFSEGVVFSVRPPKKSWKNIANLSGGEKVSSLSLFIRFLSVPMHYTIQERISFSLLILRGVFLLFIFQTLSSLALVFALHHYKPTPLYVMDEIDAALGTCY